MTDTSNSARGKQINLPDQSVHLTSYKTLTIDYALYEHLLETSDLSDQQKREFLDTLWNIIVNFVDLGFGVHPLQQIADASNHRSACEQNAIPLEYLTPDSGDVVSLENLIKIEANERGDVQSGTSSEKEES